MSSSSLYSVVCKSTKGELYKIPFNDFYTVIHHSSSIVKVLNLNRLKKQQAVLHKKNFWKHKNRKPEVDFEMMIQKGSEFED